MKKINGFHLIELLITLAIVGILLTLTIPIYTQHFRHVRRLQAQTFLMTVSLHLEQYYITHHTYEKATLATLHLSDRALKKYYDIHILSTNHDYTIRAKPHDEQARDVYCATLSLDSTGQKEFTGIGKKEDCW